MNVAVIVYNTARETNKQQSNQLIESNFKWLGWMKMKADLDIIEFKCFFKLELLDSENYEAEVKALYDLLNSMGWV